MKRRDIRELMMQILYQMEIQEEYSVAILEGALQEHKLSEKNNDYVNKIYNIVIEQKEVKAYMQPNWLCFI